MKITWLGHSSFLIEGSNGIKLLTDPFDESVGYKVYNDCVDVITISHHHFDHDYTKGAQGNPAIIDKVGSTNIKNISLEGIPSYHDNMNGSKRGSNTIFIIELDGYRVCHLGDLGHTLSQETLAKFGDIDVLFIPVGGNFTINGKEAAEIAKSIKSHIVIPMHYKTPCLAFPLEGVESFVTNMKNAESLHNSTLELIGELSGENKVKLLNVIDQ